MGSSHFIGGETPFLHAHRRSVPAQYFYSGVRIGVGFVAAMTANEARLAFAASFVYATTNRTGLTSVVRGDFAKKTAALFEFVGEQGFELKPALIEDGSIQTGFLADVATGLLDGSLRARRHVRNLQVFEDDGSEAIGEVGCDLVMPMLTDASTLGGQFGASALLLQPALGAPLTARQDALCGAVATFEGLERLGNREHLAGTQGQCIGDATVYADAWPSVSDFGHLNGAGEADVPAKRIGRDRGSQYVALDRARISELHPTYLGYPDGGPFCVEALKLDLSPLKAKAIIHALAARSRIACSAGKEVGEGPVKILEGLLLACLSDCGDPNELGA